MSIKVINDVWQHSKAAGTDLLVLLALADNANDQGECWPSIGYVARKCRIDTRTTQRRIRSLETLGEVVVIRGAGKASTAGGTKSNKYRIIVHIPEDEGGGDLPGSGTDARDGVAPVPGDGVAPVPPEPFFESSLKRQSLAPVKADAEVRVALRAAVIQACQLDPDRITSSAEGALSKATKDISEIGATAEDVAEAANAYRSRFPQASVTPLALAKHWPALSGSSSPTAGTPRLSEADRVGISVARRTADLEEAKSIIADEFYGDPDDALAAWARTRDFDLQFAGVVF